MWWELAQWYLNTFKTANPGIASSIPFTPTKTTKRRNTCTFLLGKCISISVLYTRHVNEPVLLCVMSARGYCTMPSSPWTYLRLITSLKNVIFCSLELLFDSHQGPGTGADQTCAEWTPNSRTPHIFCWQMHNGHRPKANNAQSCQQSNWILVGRVG